jgi:hypothetical protein
MTAGGGRRTTTAKGYVKRPTLTLRRVGHPEKIKQVPHPSALCAYGLRMTIKSKKQRRRAKATAKGEKQPQRQKDDDERLTGRRACATGLRVD